MLIKLKRMLLLFIVAILIHPAMTWAATITEVAKDILITDALTFAGRDGPDVFEGSKGRFVVSWHDDSRSAGTIYGFDVFAAVINSSGKLIVQPRIVRPRYEGRVGDLSTDNVFIPLAKEKYAFVWSKLTSGGAFADLRSLYIRILDANLKPLSQAKKVFAVSAPASIAAFDCNKNRRCFVLWRSDPNQSAKMFLRVVNLDTFQSSKDIKISDRNENIIIKSSNFGAVAYWQGPSAKRGIYIYNTTARLRIVDQEGLDLSGEILLGRPARIANQSEPVVASSERGWTVLYRQKPYDKAAVWSCNTFDSYGKETGYSYDIGGGQYHVFLNAVTIDEYAIALDQGNSESFDAYLFKSDCRSGGVVKQPIASGAEIGQSVIASEKNKFAVIGPVYRTSIIKGWVYKVK